jgi:tripartite-type tricarboxylate transporter receptor subunit TctC
MPANTIRTLIALCLCGAPLAAHAQTFPGGPVNVVVPLAPGDAADVATRAMSEEMARVLNTPVLVINRPGAGGALGARSVVQAKKDGQTILFAPNAALTFRTILDAQAATYDAFRDLLPLGLAARTPTVLLVRKEATQRNLAELITEAKKARGQISIGHAGTGSVGEFGIALINTLSQTEFSTIPYSGAGPAAVALRGGHVEGAMIALGAAATHIRAGALRGLAISQRAPEFADIPTLREQGFAEELFGVWFGFLAPAGIPEDARKTLVAAVEQAVKQPAIAAKLAPLGILQGYGAPGEMAAEMREEFRRVSDVARKTGMVK